MRFWQIPIGTLGAAGLLIVFTHFLPLNRSDYRAVDFNAPWQQDFWRRYKAAWAREAPWLEDPEAIALRVAGYPNLDNTQPEHISLSMLSPEKVIVTIQSGQLQDDSVSERETRVDLSKDGELWKIAWAGQRFKCRRGVLRAVWTTNLCP